MLKGFTSPYYRNPFLVSVMVNLNMIETISSGIKRIYEIQRDKFFPLPDYDLGEKNRVMITLYGKELDQNYSRALFEKSDLTLEQVFLLDKVQKHHPITKDQSDSLRKYNLIEGRYPNVYVSSDIAVITNTQIENFETKGINNQFYMDYIYEFINRYGFATRKQINAFIKPKLPDSLTPEQQNRRVQYLLKKLREKNRIKNVGSDKLSKWVINK